MALVQMFDAMPMENKYPNKGTVVFECGCWKIKKIGNLPSFGLFYLKILFFDPLDPPYTDVINLSVRLS